MTLRRALTFLMALAPLLGGAAQGHAEVRLPKLLSDHAVLQRNAPIRIWGWADPGAVVTADFHHQHVTATADRLGEWVAWLMPEPAGGPYSLKILSSANTQPDTRPDAQPTTVNDIMVGDVWIASGQSNMELPLLGFQPNAPLKNGAAEIAAANHPNLRLLIVPETTSAFPLDDQPAVWTQCTPETAKRFSAVAYFFGRDLADKEHVTIGLVDSTWGGTPADSWVSMDAFGSDPALIPAFASRAAFAGSLARSTAIIAADKRDDDAAVAAGKPAPSHMWHPNPASWMPSWIYNGMIAPLTPFSVAGFIWYQGETNSSPDRAPFYRHLFQALIQDWRQHFAQGDLPFLYAQISSFNSPGEDWGLIRDAQRRALSLDRTAMVVTLDVGQADNVHPPDKQTVGARLALAAQAVAYHQDVQYASPLFRQATIEPAGMRVWFDHAETLSSHGKPLTGFELAGEDHHFVPAEAAIEGQTVLVKSAALPHPLFVRYGWQGFVQDYLYNDANLPASTFTSEDQPRR